MWAWDIRIQEKYLASEVILGVSVGSKTSSVMLIDGLDLSGSRIQLSRQDHM